jgi:hypothetical protein
MKVSRFALVYLALSLAATCQQESSSPQGAPIQNDSPAIVADHPSANDASKLDLTPDAQGKLSQEQMQKLLRVVAEKDMENDKRQRDYTYIERDVQNKMDGKGDTKSTEIKTFEVLEIYGEQVQRLTQKDDKPLDAKEAAKEEEKIQKIIDKRKNESENDRRKREEKEEKDREDERKFVMEVADAYNFTLVGSEQIGGRDAWVIDGEPRPGFEPHMKDAKYLIKFHGRVWIDKDDLQLAKMDLECLDTITWGGFLARFHKGSRIMMEQTRVNDEVWLPQLITGKIDVRFALVKNYNVGFEQNFHDYKKFRTSTKIIGMGEPQEQK